MKVKMMPVVTARELENAVNLQYGEGTIEDIKSLLFCDGYTNDCYKSLCFKEEWDDHYDPECDDPEDEEPMRLRNLVTGYLRDVFTDIDTILVDVSW